MRIQCVVVNTLSRVQQLGDISTFPELPNLLKGNQEKVNSRVERRCSPGSRPSRRRRPGTGAGGRTSWRQVSRSGYTIYMFIIYLTLILILLLNEWTIEM